MTAELLAWGLWVVGLLFAVAVGYYLGRFRS